MILSLMHCGLHLSDHLTLVLGLLIVVPVLCVGWLWRRNHARR